MNPLLYVGIAILIIIGLIIFLGVIYSIMEPILKAVNDSKQSVIERRATIIAKRQELWAGATASPYTTSYYASFEMESGDRVELEVEDTDYGLMIEGDAGVLVSQGETFKGFQREKLKAQ